jgi:hypothetical protein
MTYGYSLIMTCAFYSSLNKSIHRERGLSSLPDRVSENSMSIITSVRMCPKMMKIMKFFLDVSGKALADVDEDCTR